MGDRTPSEVCLIFPIRVPIRVEMAATEKLSAHRLTWLVGTLEVYRGGGLGHIVSFCEVSRVLKIKDPAHAW